MRARNIKPGFFKNDRLAELNPFTRILFAGLWCMADRAGRLEDRPKRIKAEVLPYDDWDVDAALSTLDGEFIKRYSVDGNQFIQILHFSDHQNPHKNEKESEIPPYQHSTSTVQEPKKHSTNPADSLIPDSLIPDSNTPPTPPQGGRDVFEEFWKIYPKKVGKGAARKAWKQVRAPTQTLSEISAALSWQTKTEQWQKNNGQYIPNPATYLNQRRWEDERTAETDRYAFMYQ